MPGELRRHLSQKLPEGMLPAWYVELPAIPRLPNGKVDETALPAPNSYHSNVSPAPMAPRTLLERQLVRLWSETLGRQNVGISDNFFELGGHSLLAASLVARLKSTLGLELPLAVLFQSPTIADLAAAIVQGGQAPGRLSSLVPFKPTGTRLPFFCVHPLGGGAGGYAPLARHMCPEQPFYGLQAKGLDDESQQNLTFENLAKDYLSEIRTLQAEGPYRLGGYSSGGLIAFEMACQLTEAGERVALVALLDSYAPASLGRVWRREALVNWLASFPYWLIDFAHLERQEILERLGRLLRVTRWWHHAETASAFVGQSGLTQMTPRQQGFVQAHFQAAQAYQPRPYTGKVTLFRARAQARSRAFDPDKGWRALALGGVEIREIPGSHHTLLAEPYVGELARHLRQALDDLG
jgi:thioesterase domain-containing protein/acyl carrier protein